MKFVIIGAGSQVFGQRSIIDILTSPVLVSTQLEIVLVDTNENKLKTMLNLGKMVQERLQSPAKLWATTDRVEALVDADYVFISVSIQRYTLWEQDFRVPFAYGFKQAYGENGGPGALFHALRNIHLVMEICSDIERLAPSAFVFNFSNPESRILLALKNLSPLKTIGLCHGQHDALQTIGKLLNRSIDTIEIRGGGINHLFWLQEIKDSITGEDLYPAVKEAAANNNDPLFTLPKKLLEIYGMLTYPDNTHAGEFFSWGSEYMNGKWVHGLESRRVGALHKSQIDVIAPILDGTVPLDPLLVQSREIAIPIIETMITGNKREFLSANVKNTELYIPNLQEGGIVEVPITVDGQGIHPQTINALDEGVAAFCRNQISIQMLTVEAYQHRSKQLLLQALLLEPTVDSIVKAEAYLDDMLELQRDYIPEFT